MWHLHLLGQVRVVRGEDIISRFRTRKAEALLAFLAHHRTRPHRREDLLDLLWPDAAPEAARNSLSVALSTLRTQLEGTGDPPRVVFRADRSSIGILREALTTDVEAFETALRSAEAAPEYSAEQIRHLEAAVGLYEAPFLAEHEAAWVEFERQRLAESYGRALHRLAERLAASGQHGQAVERVQRGLAIDPRNELAHADLMSILSALGDVDGALRHFDELQAIAAKDDELVIGRSLRSLAAELRARAAPGHAPAAEPAPWDTRPASRERGQADGGSTDDTGTLSLVVVDGLDDLAALGTVVSEEGGRLLRSVDRGAVFAFGRASEALVCAVRVHRAVAAGAEGGQVVPRLAIHLGEFGRTGRGADEHLPAGAIDDTVVDWALRLAMSAHPGQIVCSEPAAALLRQKLPPGIWMRDLGVYRLAEQAMPERVFQAEYPDMPVRQFAPLNAAGHASRLPQHLTRFFGRERELSHLEDLLLGGEVRLVTVQGPGGTGKGRLCLETAHRLVDVLQGAVWFVPLADVSEGERIPAAIRAALGQPELPGADPLEQVCELLRQRPALLALDNFEHLADVGSGVVGELLERVPRLMCLVSSRRSLGLAGEHAYHLQPLPTPARPYDVDALLSCESVRLFVDRAQAVRADFHLTAGNAEDVAELCGRLEGLPLALELAASRIAVLSLSQMLDKLGQALDLFTTRQRSVPARHRTLRAAIAWSYDVLSPELQDVFARLSVFRGGCTAEAAEAVCAGPAALDHLAALAECSLVEAADGSRVRFRMLDTIRTFAAERLEVQVGAEVRRRHFLHYLALATAGQAALECGEEGDWLERLGAEHENFGAAFDWALEEHPEGALELAGALWRYWLVKGHWADAEQLLARSLERAPQAPPALRARALGWAGHIALRRGHYARAAELLALSLSLCRELDDRPGVGNALNELGKLAWAQGDHRRARTYYEQSLEIREALGNPWSIAATVSNLGVAAWALGDLDAATARLEQALELRRELHDRRGLAGTLRNLGSLAHARGDEAAARRHHEESLSIWRDVGDRAGVAQGLSELGLVAHA
ncbi:MAG: tetratricopeptide repeat protein, partial [Armatimonadetes bacterium]|nr:tetratricopeptide repeat protein [Armatimonadota bacterium]